MKTTLKNFYQNRAPRELKAGNVYPFHIPHVHFDEANDTLNVVFSLKNEKTGRSHYLLESPPQNHCLGGGGWGGACFSVSLH